MDRFPKKYSLTEVFSVIEYKTDDLKYLSDPSKVLFRPLDWIKKRKMFDGHMVKLTSSRLRLFSLKGTTCVACGVVGSFFVKERCRGEDNYHLNLYAVKDGLEILMTKDHILPKSLGGKNHIDNYQTMCTICNNAKGNNILWQATTISGECGNEM